MCLQTVISRSINSIKLIYVWNMYIIVRYAHYKGINTIVFIMQYMAAFANNKQFYGAQRHRRYLQKKTKIGRDRKRTAQTGIIISKSACIAWSMTKVTTIFSRWQLIWQGTQARFLHMRRRILKVATKPSFLISSHFYHQSSPIRCSEKKTDFCCCCCVPRHMRAE